MNMYDTFMGIVECPHCNQKTKMEHKFKWSDCRLKRYYAGDLIPESKMDDTFLDENRYDEKCDHCKKPFRTSVIIHNGQYILMDVQEKVDERFEKNKYPPDEYPLNERYQFHHVHPLQGKHDFRDYEIQNAKLKSD